MPTVKVPLVSDVFTSVDETVLNDNAAIQYNGYIDDLGGINVRPGINRVNSFTYNPLGIFWWDAQSKLIVPEIGFAEMYTTSDSTSFSILSGPATTGMLAGSKCTFADEGSYLFFANGGRINYFDTAGALTVLADADAPTAATHVAFLDSYILANNGNNRFYWSDVAAPTSWSALNFASAAGGPDAISALHTHQRQIYLFGRLSTEIWENDGTTPFSRVPGGFIEIGCAAPMSVVKLDQSLIWLSNKRYFVEASGRSIEKVSSPYDQVISEMSSVSDCVADRIDFGGGTFCVFQFPTAGKTLIYEPETKQWGEYGTWRDDVGAWLPFDFLGATYIPNYGKTYMVGSNTTGILMLDPDRRKDTLSISGSQTDVNVKYLRRTGHIDYGTSKMKRSNQFRFRVRRGDTAGTGSEVLIIRWRDNGSPNWSNIKEINLGDAGSTDFIVKLHRTGIFRTRQYEISMTDQVPISISDAEEDIEVLR